MKHASRVSVTGAAGFLGSHICRALLARGYEVIGIERIGSERKLHPDIRDHVETRRADLSDCATLISAFKGSDAVVHTAAMVSIRDDVHEETAKVNLSGVRNVIDACTQANVSKLIHISSIHAFEPIRGIHVDPDAPLAFDSRIPYNRSKAGGHNAVLEAIYNGLIGGSLICPAGLIGPIDDRPSLVGGLLLDIANQKLPMLMSEGFWWSDVRDVAAAAANALALDENGNVYFTAGIYATLQDLANRCSDFLGRNVTPLVVPYVVAMVGLPFVQTYAKLRRLSPLYTRASLNVVRDCPTSVEHQPAIEDIDYQIRPLHESINDSLSWFQDNRMIA